MGLKKYEIITVGGNKRVRALRSWQVGDRYVNIGDVGGIVYDEKTLSQDGNAWIFKGNMGSPTIRISGDAIVDITEGTVSNAVKALLTIDGQSKVVGAAANLNVRTSNTAWELTPDMFEQGNFSYTAGINWETWKRNSVNYVRLKQPIYVGGATGLSLAVLIAGFAYQLYFMDRDGVGIAATAGNVSGPGVNISIPATAVYMTMRITKSPQAATVPADIATAKPTLSNGTVEGYFLIRDSAITITNTVAGTAAFRITQTGPGVNGTSVPGSSIVNSTVNIYKPGNLEPSLLIATDMVNTNATITTTAATNYDLLGVYDNVKNLMVTSELGIQRGAAGAETIITAKDCQDFAYSSTVFPGAAAAQTANRPFRFVRCNVPDGRFYDHAQILNQYTDIDFSKATADLGKTTVNKANSLVSSEVQGMYRLYSTGSSVFGMLVEKYNSIRDLTVNPTGTYNTTIYKDAYVRGPWGFAGTNVFGHKVRSHPLEQVLNVQPRVVQGNLNTATPGQTVTGVIPSDIRVCIPTPFRINGANGLKIEGLSATLEALVIFVTPSNVVTAVASSSGGVFPFPAAQLNAYAAYVRFGKTGDAAITPEDLAGVTVTVYNGCKIVNTGATAVNMKGSIRVEDNATLVNASITGSGYFGGNSVVYYNPTVWASLDFTGTVYMKDDAVFAPSALTGANALVRMEGNAKFTGSVDAASTNLSFIMRDNAVIEGKANTRSGVVMSGNSKVTAAGQITAASRGVLVMEDNASIEANTTVIGAITLSGNYKGNAVKTWTGKRTITDVNAPEYDNNVKTQYDF